MVQVPPGYMAEPHDFLLGPHGFAAVAPDWSRDRVDRGEINRRELLCQDHNLVEPINVTQLQDSRSPSLINKDENPSSTNDQVDSEHHAHHPGFGSTDT
jgi:hypothetical protein